MSMTQINYSQCQCLQVAYIILNLFIAVIFEGFEESRQVQVDNLLQTCMECWQPYDPELNLIIQVDKALQFVTDVLRKTGNTNADWEKDIA
jgi:hypothetical protein